MKCRICGCDSDNERLDEMNFDAAPIYKSWICWNCWYETTYNSYSVRDIIIKDTSKGERTPNTFTFTTVEYLLGCIECKHQTGYGYLWFAIQDGREHVIDSGHKSVTISEIMWQEDKLLEIIRIDINFLL
jgi:hypothetical protein